MPPPTGAAHVLLDSDPRLAAWYLCFGHRAVWGLLFLAGLPVALGLLLLRAQAQDPQANFERSRADLLAFKPAPVPDAQNARLDYEAAGALYVEPSVFYGALTPLQGTQGDPHDSWTWTEQEGLEYLESGAPGFDLLHAATRKPRCDWDLEYAKGGIALPVGHLVRLKGFGRGLLVEASLRARAGDHAGAARAVEALFMLARRAESDPMLISGLVAVSIEYMACQAVQDILERATPSRTEEVRAYLDAVPPGPDPFQSISAAMKCERAMGLYELDRMVLGQARVSGLEVLPRDLGQVVYGGERASYERFMNAIVAKCEARESIQVGEFRRAFDAHADGSAIFARMMIPSIERAQEQYLRAADLRVAARAALAALLYRLERGRDVAALEDLVPAYLPEIPRGWRRGEPLRLRVDAHGYQPTGPHGRPVPPGLLRIYALGHNGEDDYGYCKWVYEKLPPELEAKIAARVPDRDANFSAQSHADDAAFRLPPPAGAAAAPSAPAGEELEE